MKTGEQSEFLYFVWNVSEFDMLSYVPKDIAILALDGNRNYLGKVFNLGDLSAKSRNAIVFHLGFH
jgi:hypothetical protein